MTDCTKEIIGAAIDVHNAIGPGLLESAYERCLAYELNLRGIRFVQQLPLPLIYKQLRVDYAYRVDFLVDDVVVEVKSIASIDPIHMAQMITYMKLGNWSLGLLINFNVTSLTRGIRRVVLNPSSPSSPSSPLR
ncbi:MAG TPA: GxxExxY protein [Thermoanaerobaculia bacterium]|nr:GxxExxY protein [Thermoanaerobaculia bacterium]